MTDRSGTSRAADGGVRMSSAISGQVNPIEAAELVANQVGEGLSGLRADLALLFFSKHHVDSAKSIARTVQRRLPSARVIGISGESVIGGASELEGEPGVSLLGMHLPGVELTVFRVDQLPTIREGSVDNSAALASAAGFGPGHRATLLFADPFSVPMNTLLPTLIEARDAELVRRTGCADGKDARGNTVAPAPIIGGMASAGSKPGGNTLLIDDTVLYAGGVGVSMSGSVRVDALVSQGCKPLGPPMVITRAKGQMIQKLGGHSAINALLGVLEHEGTDIREEIIEKRALFVGRAITEYKDRFGRDDFLIRNVIGVDKNNGAIAVGDLVRVGQTVQFHMRDAQLASEDLALLLDKQQLHDPAAGALLCVGNGRGKRLFGTAHHDAAMIERALRLADADTPGTELARGGRAIQPGGGVALAGFFAAGEIGPVGDRAFVHGQAVSAAIFRDGEDASDRID